MIETRFMQSWVHMIGSLAMIALILTAFGVMLGMVKPADSVKLIGAIVGILMVFLIIPGVVASAWLSMSIWQRLGLTLIGMAVLLLIRPKRPQKNRINR